MQKNKMTSRIWQALLMVAPMVCVSCVTEGYDEKPVAEANAVSVALTLQTRAATSTSETYEEGTEWENYIDMTSGDYCLYFFTSDKDDESTEKNTLIAEFLPTDILSLDGAYATYYVSGEVDEAITAYSDFKVVVLANWGGNYPETTAGVTTIDELVEGQYTTYSAFVDQYDTALMPSSSLHIPFFGIHEYTDVTWTAGRKTNLDGDITLLRALAKVEIVFVNDDVEDESSFSDVTIHRYNATGYCAPAGVYVQADYDHNYVWDDDFTDEIHLLNGANDTEEKTISFVKTQERVVDEASGAVTQYEVWTAYVPEYDNTTNAGETGDDYSYMSLYYGAAEYNVYFANYTEGKTTAYDEDGNTNDRYDIYRNYLYRYNVSVNSLYLYVTIDVLPWVERLDNIEF